LGGDNGNDAVVQRFGLRSGTWTALAPGIALRDGTARAKAKAKAKATANAGGLSTAAAKRRLRSRWRFLGSWD